MIFQPNVPVGSTVYLPFSTNDADGARAGFDATLEAADFEIYKNGSTTQRASDAGVTISETFDSMTGLHLLAVDLSDDSDAGFYVAGATYLVALYPDETLASQNVAAWVGGWSIGPVGGLVTGTATAGGATSITLASAASTTADYYNGQTVAIIDGTGVGQSRQITDYSTGRVASVEPDWLTNPSTDSVYVLIPTPPAVDSTYPSVNTVQIEGTTASTKITSSVPTVAQMADAVWDEGTAGHVVSGTFGEQCKTDIDAILVDTGEIGVAGAGLTALGGMSSGMKSEVNAEMTDVLGTDTLTEPSQGIPPANPTIKQVMSYLYMKFRNKVTVTSSELAIYNDAGTKLAKKTVSDDGTTYTEAEMVSG